MTAKQQRTNIKRRNKVRVSAHFIVMAVVWAMLSSAPDAITANGTWNGTTNSTWSIGTNWSGGSAPGSGETATFNNAGNGHTTIDLGSGITVNTILFDTSSAAAYTIGSGAVGGQSLTLNNGGAVTMNSTVTANELFNANVTLGTDRSDASFTFTNNSSSGTLTFAGNIVAGTGSATKGTKTLTLTGTGNGTISGAYIQGTADGALIKSGSGTWTLSGANTYIGGTTISAGTLEFAKTNAMPSTGSVTANSGATLAVNVGGTGEWTNGASGGGTLGGLIAGTGGQGTANQVSWTAGSVLGIDTSNASGGNFTYSNVIGSFRTGGNSVGLTKLGTGTLTLSGANTYTGATTVSGGTLLVNGSLASGSAVTVNGSGSILGGTGTINGTVTINSGAAILGGTGTTGATQKLTASNNLTLSSGSIIELALGAGGAHSTLARIGGTWSFQTAQQFTFIDLGATTGTYQDIITGLASNPGTGSWTITNPGWSGTFTYDGANIDLTLTAVPEPSTWIGGALALLAIGCTQRKRFARFFKRA
jgi:autotransporter-associated beta strand protein